MKHALQYLFRHKFMVSVALLALTGGGYFGYGALVGGDAATRYVVAQIERGTLIVSLSGSGEVAALRQVDIKPRASGDVVRVGVKTGDEVRAGALIAALDAREVEKTVRDAEANLENAKISLAKLQQPPDALTMLQAENSLRRAEESKARTETTLAKAYEDGFNVVTDAFLALPDAIAGLQAVLFENDFRTANGQNIDYYADSVSLYDERAPYYKRIAQNAYDAARASYDDAIAAHNASSRFSTRPAVEALIEQSREASQDIAEAVKAASNLIQFHKDALTERNLRSDPLADTHLADLGRYTGTVNTRIATLLASTRAISDGKIAVVNAERDIAERGTSLTKLKAGPDALDTKSQKLSMRQRENSLRDAREKLADYAVRAPFDGVIAKLNVKKGDTASANTALATLIARERLAEISLNEIDVAWVGVGQKATLAFDAVPDLTVSGRVTEVDIIGAASQGVVTYGVKIAFDTQDARIKPGMSVTASVITAVKQNALLAPNSAVKTQGEMSYVEVAGDAPENSAASASASGVILKNPPNRTPVEIGAANDEFTEIVSGVSENDRIVIRTIQPNTTPSQSQQQNSLFRLPGGGGSMRPAGGFR